MTERYNVIRPTVARDFYEAVGAPEWAKFKIVFRQDSNYEDYRGTKYYRTKADAEKALKAKQNLITKTREAAKKPPVPPKKDKFLVKVGKPTKTNNVIKQKFEEVIGSRNVPSTYKKTGVVKDQYRALITVNDKTVLSTDFGTKADATAAVEKYRKANPIKNPPPDLKTLDEQKKKRYLDKQAKSKAIKERGGYYSGPHTGTTKAHLGHTGNVFGIEKITGDRLAYTPAEINQAMSSEGEGLDSKIRKVSEKIEKLKKQNLPPARKKKLLEQADALLVRLASQSQGFKKVTLSDGSTFGGNRLTIDMLDEFPGWTEREINEFVKKWKDEKIITEEMVRKNPSLKVTPPDEVENIKKANFFEINRKEALKAAEKIGKTEQTRVIEHLNKFIKKVKATPGGCQAVVKRALGFQGGLFNETCETIIKANPKAAAVKLNNAITATKGPLKELKDDSKKLANLIDTGQVTTADKLPRPDDAVLRDTFKEANIRWNNDIGAFETANGNVATQEDLKLYAEENPMEVKVGEEPPKVNKSVLKTVGRTLAKVGAPLPTAVLDSYFIGQQIKDGKSTAEIAKDPLNWIGLAAMEPLSKVSGIAESGGLNKALRLGLNPATIRGISRFAGLPGLAISTAMTAYDQYKKYQNEEGFVYNLFNKEGT